MLWVFDIGAPILLWRLIIGKINRMSCNQCIPWTCDGIVLRKFFWEVVYIWRLSVMWSQNSSSPELYIMVSSFKVFYILSRVFWNHFVLTFLETTNNLSLITRCKIMSNIFPHPLLFVCSGTCCSLQITSSSSVARFTL